MDYTTLSLILSSVALLISLLLLFLWNQSKTPGKEKSTETAFQTKPLQLQAYERLVLLTERIALPNLISRCNQPGLSAREMQLFLLESIRQEFEYNTSQQIYVSAAAWQALQHLKEQNILIINQVAQTLPEDAKGIDLNKKIMEAVMRQDKNTWHTLVLEAMNFEAQKLMK